MEDRLTLRLLPSSQGISLSDKIVHGNAKPTGLENKHNRQLDNLSCHFSLFEQFVQFPLCFVATMNEPGVAREAMLNGADQQEREYFTLRDRPTLTIFLR